MNMSLNDTFTQHNTVNAFGGYGGGAYNGRLSTGSYTNEYQQNRLSTGSYSNDNYQQSSTNYNGRMSGNYSTVVVADNHMNMSMRSSTEFDNNTGTRFVEEKWNNAQELQQQREIVSRSGQKYRCVCV